MLAEATGSRRRSGAERGGTSERKSIVPLTTFPPLLQSYAEIRANRSSYLGPTTESNWVIPGRLMAGAFPSSLNDEENEQILWSILQLGITTFVCLQQEYQNDGVTEAMWRRGQALRPYFHDAVKVLRDVRQRSHVAARQRLVHQDDLKFVHFPIVDCSVGDDDSVAKLAFRLVERMRNGEVIYLHCWGGHGRTGTVICIMLYIMYGYTSTEAFRRCQFVHDIRRFPIEVGSPQTQPQRDQVVRVIAKLTVEAEKKKQAAKEKTAAVKAMLKKRQQQQQQQQQSSASSLSSQQLPLQENRASAVIHVPSIKKPPPQQQSMSVLPSCTATAQQAKPKQRTVTATAMATTNSNATATKAIAAPPVVDLAATRGSERQLQEIRQSLAQRWASKPKEVEDNDAVERRRDQAALPRRQPAPPPQNSRPSARSRPAQPWRERGFSSKTAAKSSPPSPSPSSPPPPSSAPSSAPAAGEAQRTRVARPIAAPVTMISRKYQKSHASAAAAVSSETTTAATTTTTFAPPTVANPNGGRHSKSQDECRQAARVLAAKPARPAAKCGSGALRRNVTAPKQQQANNSRLSAQNGFKPVRPAVAAATSRSNRLL